MDCLLQATCYKPCRMKLLSEPLMPKAWLAWSLFLGALSPTIAADRVVQSADLGWRFHLGDVPEAKATLQAGASWRTLDLPHDWSLEGDYDATNATGFQCGFLPSGVGWYQRTLELPEAWQGRVVALEFEGVYMDSEVWLNGTRVGGRPYGYSSFLCDLTPHLKPGPNLLAVRVDNSREPSARWYHGCGIYGHVRLIVTSPVHVPYSGVFVQTPEVDAQSATVRATVELTNRSSAAVQVEVQSEVVAPDGRSVGQSSAQAAIAGSQMQAVKQECHVERPALWSLESPALYTLKTRVVCDGTVVDEVTTPFGIRSLRFDAKAGFFLNDRPTKLKGVCEHQGGSPVGAAMPEALLERRLRQLQAMGCNAIRTAHNPQPPAFYELCDRLGLLVMDEIFDGWHQKAAEDYGARFFAEWWQRDVADWVRRDRNHPCVIMWSIGNETGRKDTFRITECIQSFDTSRPVTGGAVTEGVDVAGFNGGIVPRDEILEQFHRDNPSRPIVLTEEPHTFQTRGFYRTVNDVFRSLDKLSDYAAPEVFGGGRSAYRSSYDNCGRRLVARNCWVRTVSRPWIMGEFRWTGFDYLGEAAWAGKEALPREFNFGVLDLAGFPKDLYYFYQSIWTEHPMVHVLPHWTHPGLEDKTIPVVVYANAEEVELFQDGKSLGRQPRSQLFECVWQVAYRPGELKAIAYCGGQPVAEATQRTAGAPARLQLSTDNTNLKPERNDVALVTLAVRDAQGTLVPDADNRVDLTLLGPARWLGGENGDPLDLTPQRQTGRKVFAGLARGFYAGQEGQNGPVEVVALSILAPARFNDSATVTLALERVALRGTLTSQPFELRYTTDGSAPTAASTKYSGPFTLQATTTIRAGAFRDGKAVVTSRALFTKGPPPVAGRHASADKDLGTAPATLQVDSLNVLHALGPLAQGLGAKLVYVKTLPMASEARHSMEAMGVGF
jgi:beta-galactosidase